MKKIILSALFIISSMTMVNYALPAAVCQDALQRCNDFCEQEYSWYEYPMRVGCKTGCGIGYILC